MQNKKVWGDREAGFTLVEVMVAFIIAAISLGVLYKGALGGLLSARVATQYEEAVGRARSRMASIGHGSAIVAGEQSGDDGGGFRWRTRIVVAESAKPPGSVVQGAMFATLYGISVSIAWGEEGSGRKIQLDTQRAGFAAPSGP